MPHTSRKKKPIARSKRYQIVDEDGWTRVVTGTAQRMNSIQLSSTDHDGAATQILKTEVPSDASVATLTTRFEKLQKIWLDSESCTVLRGVLRVHLGPHHKITDCIMFGSGTYCGYRQGWIGRHDVALVQTAVLLTIVDTIEQIQRLRPGVSAQEPLYNDLDTDFLTSLNIKTLHQQDGFEHLSASSLVYAPGAEREVSFRIYKSNPRMLLSHDASLLATGTSARTDDTQADSTAVQAFLSSHSQTRLPDLSGIANEPFHGQYLHYLHSPSSPPPPPPLSSPP